MLLRTHKRKVILIGIVYVKNKGGIGFRNLQTLNQGFIIKMGRRLRVDQNSLWSKTMKGKYFSHNNFENAPPPKQNHSGYWRILYKTNTICNDTSP